MSEVHTTADVKTRWLDDRARIWQYVVVSPSSGIDNDVCTSYNYSIDNDIVIVDGLTINCGVQIWHGLALEDDVFIGPNLTFINDRFPRSKGFRKKFLRTIVRKGASLSANATILPGLEIGSGAFVGAGSVVTRSVPLNAIAVGNPARITGYVDADEPQLSTPISKDPTENKVITSAVCGVTLHELPDIVDMRGSLSIGEFERSIPRASKRYFLVFDVPSRVIRGGHAHRLCHQFLICKKGSCTVVADDGKQRREFLLDRPNLGGYLPAMIWGIQYKYPSDAVLLLFASEYYDSRDYIRYYSEFMALAGSAR